MELKVEVFSVGKWNGIDFTVQDLQLMANAFSKLGENHKVPLKMGHNEEQPFTDGQPALGWVNDLAVEGEKLIAHMTDIPDVVYTAFQSKLYRHVSIELDMGVEHKGEHYPFVLSGVALLGADIPAVNNIGDLSQFMSRDFKSSKKACFTATNKPAKEDAGMTDLEKMQAQLDSLTASLASKDSQIADLAADKVKFERDNTDMQAKIKATEEANKKAEFSRKKADLEVNLEKLITDKKIIPAQREAFMAQYKDDDTVIDLLNANIDVLAMSASVDNDGENGSQEGAEEGAAHEIVFERANKIMEKQTGVNFSTATDMVLKADKDLAKRWSDIN